MKTKEDKLDVDKLVPGPVDFSKLSEVVRNDVVKNSEYDGVVKKVYDIKTTDTSDLA